MQIRLARLIFILISDDLIVPLFMHDIVWVHSSSWRVWSSNVWFPSISGQLDDLHLYSMYTLHGKCGQLTFPKSIIFV